jgi:hypothetical protein
MDFLRLVKPTLGGESDHWALLAQCPAGRSWIATASMTLAADSRNRQIAMCALEPVGGHAAP